MAPQQAWLRGTSTSQPFSCSTRAVAQWVERNITSATQPVNNATRARRRPIAGRNSGSGGSASPPVATFAPTAAVAAAAARNRWLPPASAALTAAQSEPEPAPRASRRMGEQAEQNPAVKPVAAFCRRVAGLFHRHAEWFDQLAVLHARRTGRLASPAIEAKFQMPANFADSTPAAVRHGSHQVNSSRGLSFSSPRSRYVGQAEVHSPQCTQSRNKP